MPRSKNASSYTSTRQYVFMAWCSVKQRDNFTFPLLLRGQIYVYIFTFNASHWAWGNRPTRREKRDAEMTHSLPETEFAVQAKALWVWMIPFENFVNWMDGWVSGWVDGWSLIILYTNKYLSQSSSQREEDLSVILIKISFIITPPPLQNTDGLCSSKLERCV
jgi:nicotinamide riboside transporter PnuC